MIVSKREYERMQEQIAEWEARYESARAEARKAWDMYYNLYEERMGFLLDDYELAVMLPKNEHKLIVWNQGRFEKGIKAVELSQDGYEYVPYFKMVK